MKIEVSSITDLEKVSALCNIFFDNASEESLSFLDKCELSVSFDNDTPTLIVNSVKSTSFDNSRQPLTYRAILRDDCKVREIKLLNNKSVLQILASLVVTEPDGVNKTVNILLNFSVNHIGDSNDVELFISNLS